MDLLGLHVAFAHGHSVPLHDHPRLVEAMRAVLDVMPSQLLMPAPTHGRIEYDAERQEHEIRKIVTILHANQQTRDAHGRLTRHPSPRVTASRVEIASALGGYRAAVTALVLQGNLSIDQGEELMRIVDKVEQEEPGP
jgi:hypothetical protein